MVDVRDQYEAFPYPDRDPADEKQRLILGSPSHPLEMDHFLWNGSRDWSKPLKALVAGGGTGDGLIQLATLLNKAGRAYDITYIDLSTSSRRIAEQRAAVRGLAGITFLSGDLMQAPDLGVFDYIDCCGVLHHLPDPLEGFQALARALKPDGGLGFMVYAPYGRSGVYPLQEAFGALLDGLGPRERLAKARQVFARLPEGNPFRRSLNHVDHQQSDAGFYDLLLHSQDRPFTVGELVETLDAAGLALSGFSEPARYDPARFGEVPGTLDAISAMGVAEKLDGTIKVHVGYAGLKGSGTRPATGSSPDAVPHLKGLPAQGLAAAVAKRGSVTLTVGQEKLGLDIPRSAAPIIARIDGRASLGQMRQKAGLDAIGFGAAWAPASRVLTGWGQLWYSRLLQG